MTHKKQIKKWLNSGRSLTPWQAIMNFGCTKLSTRIGELERAGYRVFREWENVGEGRRVRKYWRLSKKM